MSSSKFSTRLKAIALDLDGTLLTSSGLPSSATLAWLKAARADGVAIVLASGRMTPRILPIAEMLGPPLTLIGYNGARVQEWTEAGLNAPLASSEVPEGIRLAVIDYCCDHSHFLNIYSGDDIVGYHPHGDYRFGETYHRQNGALYSGFYDSKEALPQAAIAKLLIITEPEDREAVYQACLSRFSRQASIVKSNPEYLEFMASGVTKGGALRQWLGLKGIHPTQVAAFGDAENDLDMLESVGHGFAVANATPGLKAVFGRISRFSQDQDVIVHELEGLL